MQEIELSAIRIDRLTGSSFFPKGIEADMLRLDRIHPLVSGNKWFKLRFYLEAAIREKKSGIISFGGAWSNHILATAAACRLAGLTSAGIIRGERPAILSPVLQQAAALGMQFAFISRTAFAAQALPAMEGLQNMYVIPAGGYGAPGAAGAATIAEHCPAFNRYTHICCAVGTGTMLAGLTLAASPAQQLTGISVLKNNFQLEADVAQLTGQGYKNWTILHDYHFGGYAKQDPALLAFMNDWYRETGIPTDFVYTGKLCFAIRELAKKGFFPAGSRLLLIHSGGLSGNTSLKKGTLIC